jgi:hypothetical protein
MKTSTVSTILAFAAWWVGCSHLLASNTSPQAPVEQSPVAATSGNDRLRIFISDTHFGPGKVNGQWHPYEDFRWATEFGLFLAEMKRQGKGNTDLIFNGDTLELWQSLENDCVVKGKPNLGCTESGALHRMQRVLDNHRAELDSIGDFARDRNNQVIVVPGNHDAVLLFPAVAKALLDAIKAPGHATVASAGYWLSPDGLVYSEHGHQIAKEVNTFDSWPKPFITDGGKQYIQRPWGQQFVQQYYNDFEGKYPIIDNVLGESNGLKFGMKAEGRSATFLDVGKFFSFYLADLSFKQKVTPVMGAPGQPPSWDYAAIRGQGDRFLVESIPKDDDFRVLAQQLLDQGKFGQSLKNLSNDDITDICNFRQSKIADDRELGRQPSLQPCPSVMGALQSLFNSRDKIFKGHFDKTIQLLVQQHNIQRRFQVFVWSHTHEAEKGFKPREHEGDGWNPMVVNTGAWQRIITAAQLTEMQADRKLNDKQILQLGPEDLPACYPFVLVRPYQTQPVSSLQFWRKTATGWAQGDDCGQPK